MKPVLYLIGLVALFTLGLSFMAEAGNDDFQTWQWWTVPIYEKGNLRFHGYFETHWTEDSSHFALALISPQVDYKVLPYTRVGLNYTFIRSNPFEANYHDQHRVEPQISNSFPLTGSLNLEMRNRLEIRWIDGQSKTDERIRSRVGIEYKIKDMGILTGIYTNDEVFWDITVGKINENRFIPLGIEFTLSKNVTLDLFNMIESIEQSKGGWDQNIILGTHLRFKF